MRLAVISDIHSNLIALKTVLKDIDKRQMDEIYCLGDIVSKGSSPVECLDLVLERCNVIIKGNCDDYVNNLDNKHCEWYREKLGKERVDILGTFPIYKDILMSGKNIRFFHASKDNLEYRVIDSSTFEKKMKLFEDDEKNIDVVVYADTHKQVLDKIIDKTLINTGSVGNPVDMSYSDRIEGPTKNNYAHYCILEGDLNVEKETPFSVQLISIPYDINIEIEEAKKQNIPDLEQYIEELKTGKYSGKRK